MNAQNTRASRRVPDPITASVKGKDAGDASWNETINVISYSKNGAGFYISRECQVGRLVSLLIALPESLRAYDKDKELYRVWGVIQHCSLMKGEKKPRYHVGIAFIGRSSPLSYQTDPLQTYLILGSDKTGMWKISETDHSFVVRRTPRYWITLNVNLSFIGEKKDARKESLESPKDEDPSAETAGESVTENLSLNGASVVTDLEATTGEIIEFTCPDFEFFDLARICDVRRLRNNRNQLHLEFLNKKFPIKKITLPVDSK
ncbi:MAG: PilZ domain-containing protein [Pyrinomonadaceae bacterium]